MLQYNVGPYIKGYDVCLALKMVPHKFYNDHQSLTIPITVEVKHIFPRFVEY